MNVLFEFRYSTLMLNKLCNFCIFVFILQKGGVIFEEQNWTLVMLCPIITGPLTLKWLGYVSLTVWLLP